MVMVEDVCSGLFSQYSREVGVWHSSHTEYVPRKDGLIIGSSSQQFRIQLSTLAIMAQTGQHLERAEHRAPSVLELIAWYHCPTCLDYEVETRILSTIHPPRRRSK